MNVRKSNGDYEEYDRKKLISIIKKVYKEANIIYDAECANEIVDSLYIYDGIMCSSIRKQLQERFAERDERLLESYMSAKEKKNRINDFVAEKKIFINKYKKSYNTADATVDDNSNVGCKNIGVLNAEIHKPDNIQVNRGMVMDKLKELYPTFNAKNYIRDLIRHIMYKHDESSMTPPPPYCVSLTMYPFLTNGIKRLGGLSAAPKNIDSFCGMFINLIFATASQFAGAVATPEFLLYFTYFAKKEWGDDFWKDPDKVVSVNTSKVKTIRTQIRQFFQQVVYSVNQPAASRGMQSAFWNVAYFDKLFFEGMFGDFYFPDGEKPDWESLEWIQQEFMQWFNEERLKCILTFPVESFALIYKDGKFLDERSADFVASEYARGHSFFTYISDTVDSLASCCRLRNAIQTKEFNYTNGNMSVQSGSKSVITLNLNRIIQDWFNARKDKDNSFIFDSNDKQYESLNKHINKILDRVYKYHTAYNEILWDEYDAKLLPAYSAGFIDLNKQYLTIGINGLNEAAEFLGMRCNDNENYAKFCQKIFGNIKEQNALHKVDTGKHRMMFNTECVPAESLAIKNYNWDKEDGYWVPEYRNLYASYIYLPSDESISVLEKLRLHGKNYIGDYLDGGSAAHINLNEHLSKEQYKHILKYAAENGCQYLTFNIKMSSCSCGYISNKPIDKCPKCGSTDITYWTRIIGYLTAIPKWSEGRRIEEKTRIYEKYNE